MAKTNGVNPEERQTIRIDETDRRILSLLSEDGTLSYAELGGRVHLSAPAVHERVRRLRRDGVIRGMVVKLDGEKLGRPLLSFVQVITNDIRNTQMLARLSDVPDIEEIHSVTGESGVLLKIRSASSHALEEVIARIHAIEGIIGTRSQIVFSTLLERGVSPLF